MAIQNGYISLSEIKSRLDIDSTDVEDDAKLEAMVEGVSRWIDSYCDRRFYSTSETRYYTPDDYGKVYIHDLIAASTVKTDDSGDRSYGSTWATTDYDLLPYSGSPFTAIEIAPNGAYGFPLIAKGLQISGSFGYTISGSAPKPVKEACAIQVGRIFKRKDAPFGVIGSPELGQLNVLNKLDPDVETMLAPYRRLI